MSRLRWDRISVVGSEFVQSNSFWGWSKDSWKGFLVVMMAGFKTDLLWGVLSKELATLRVTYLES